MQTRRNLIPLPYDYIQLPTVVLFALTPPELYLLSILYYLSEQNDASGAEVGSISQSPYSGRGVRLKELRNACSGLGRSRILQCLRELTKMGLIKKSPFWRPAHPVHWDAVILEERKKKLWEQRTQLNEAPSVSKNDGEFSEAELENNPFSSDEKLPEE